jgi:hypothetical protein
MHKPQTMRATSRALALTALASLLASPALAAYRGMGDLQCRDWSLSDANQQWVLGYPYGQNVVLHQELLERITLDDLLLQINRTCAADPKRVVQDVVESISQHLRKITHTQRARATWGISTP